MRHLVTVLVLCAAVFHVSSVRAEIDAEMAAFEASSQALRSADARTAAQRAAIEAMPPRLKNASVGDRAGAHIGAAGACALDIPVADINALSSLSIAEAILGQPLAQVPADGRAIARLTLDAGRTPEAAEGLRKRQQRARNLAQGERDFISRVRVAVKKINPKAEPQDCRNLPAYIADLLTQARTDGALAKAEAVGVAVEEINKRRQAIVR